VQKRASLESSSYLLLGNSVEAFIPGT